MDTVYIRPLTIDDAKVSWRWRNDKEVWRYTNNVSYDEITEAIEADWLNDVLKKNNEQRFAICVKQTDQYIGNVQLTDITMYDAQFHIFIGEKSFWGKGVASQAVTLLIDYAFGDLKLNSIFLSVDKNNLAASRVYLKVGFRVIYDIGDTNVMYLFKNDKKEHLVSIFLMTYNHEPFVRYALDGIFSQVANFSYQVFVGDDFSSDNTRDIILSYYKSYPERMNLIFHKKNIGASKNQQAIYRACNAKYIALCEGDDFWTDALKLQNQVDFLDTHLNYVGCFHNAEERYEDDINKASFLYCNYPFARNISFRDLAYANLIPTCSSVHRNNLFGDFPQWFYFLKMGDWPLNLLNAQFGDFWYIPRVMSVHRIHTKGTWSINSDNISKYTNDAYDIMIKAFSSDSDLSNELVAAKEKYNAQRSNDQKVPLHKRLRNLVVSRLKN